MTRTLRLVAFLAIGTALSGCLSGPLDYDLRGKLGGPLDTSQAALDAAKNKPQPDARGVISYPTYQVAVARRGDTVTSLSNRVGLPPVEVANFNTLELDTPLSEGQIIALPRRVETTTETSAIAPAASVDVATLAGDAIDRASPTPTAITRTPGGVEPIRHRVARGETAFTIARAYNVSPRALAQWNNLDKSFSVREGQYLLIPPTAQPQAEAPVSQPGDGSLTPTPPSASKPLPKETPAAATQGAQSKPVANIGQAASTSNAKMVMPVAGSIIREYVKGKNEGIDISASSGAPVKAAASGKVASVSATAEGVKFLLIRHPGDLITVYTHVADISVKKGDAVSRGQSIARVANGSPSFLHFEVRKGFESTDPMPYLR
ncbi:MAG: peptidoglycan DD-metalloendopeptidase family protein [Pelagimonas sp.]|jgi:murein DD-endopeptidase MepM/ murein hydrolase activator NlpD|nr:peptidoglycan DD-metalloendopeptidase family protein [Pelagimonas sp.]